MKSKLKLILKIIVSILLILAVILNVDRQLLVEKMQMMNIFYSFLIVVLIVLNYVFSSIRWKALIVHPNKDNVSVFYLIYLYFTGSFFNNFMPTSIGGDVYKVYKLGKKIDDGAVGFTATFMERFTGVIVLVFISAFGLVGIYGNFSLLLIPLMIFGIFIGIKLLEILAQRFTKLKKLYDSIIVYKGRYKLLTFAFGTSLVVQLFSIFSQYFIFSGLGVNLPVLYSLAMIPVITLASFFIPSLNGIGVQDALYIQIFARVGVSPEIALSASILYHLFRLGVSLIGGIMYALVKE